MTKINFQANTLVSLYYLWAQSFGSEERVKPILEAFQDERILSIVKAMPEFSDETFSSLKELESKLSKGEIKRFEEFEENIKILFPKDAERMLPVFKNAFEGLSAYVEKEGVKDKIEKTLKTLIADQEGYEGLLNRISVFLGFKTEQNIPCHINVYPDKKFNDGSSSDIAFQLSYSLTKDGGEYVNDTLIPVRKRCTPIHEATHYLFSHSELRKNIKTAEIYHSLCELFELHSKEKLNPQRSSKQEASLAIDEALASCSSALYKEKVSGERLPDDYEWYHGFEVVNQLAPQIYPRFKYYISEGMPLDDAFFQGLKLDLTKKKGKEKDYGIPEGPPPIPQAQEGNLSPLFLAKINGRKQ